MNQIKDKFIADLISNPVDMTTSSWIIERVPYIFSENRELYLRWKHELSKKINVDSAAILLTGSSAVGISLNPNKNYSPFSDASDIDIAIISDYYFSLAWYFLRNLGASRYSYSQTIKQSIDDHVKRYIYWGTIATDKIISILPFGKAWTIAINEMKKITPTIDKDIKLRIYKDFECLRYYQSSCLKKLRNTLLDEEATNVQVFKHNDKNNNMV